MGETYVTNLLHYVNDAGELKGDMPPSVYKIACFTSLLVDEATEAYPVDNRDSHIRCRKQSCIGSIHVTLLSRVEDIIWYCPECGMNGNISHWQGTRWDRSGSEASDQSQVGN